MSLIYSNHLNLNSLKEFEFLTNLSAFSLFTNEELIQDDFNFKALCYCVEYFSLPYTSPEVLLSEYTPSETIINIITKGLALLTQYPIDKEIKKLERISFTKEKDMDESGDEINARSLVFYFLSNNQDPDYILYRLNLRDIPWLVNAINQKNKEKIAYLRNFTQIIALSAGFSTSKEKAEAISNALTLPWEEEEKNSVSRIEIEELDSLYSITLDQ